MQKATLFTFLLIFSSFFGAKAQSLIINEISQGVGTAEWVELMVVGNPCVGSGCVDLRGYIIDDNNGNFATGSGVGIAEGAIRFANDPFWSCVPVGTIIVVGSEIGSSLSTTGDCAMSVDVSSNLFDGHETMPNSTDPTYPNSGWVNGGGMWSNVTMNNSNDAFQIISPSGSPEFSVTWGNNSGGTIEFSGPSGGSVFYLDNGSSTNSNSTSNWSQGTVASSETPGAPNSAANEAWFNSMNNSCQGPLEIETLKTPEICSGLCNGTAEVNASGGATPYSYEWSNGATSSTISGLCAGSYTITVTDANGCDKEETVTILSSPSFSLIDNITNETCAASCNGSISLSPSTGSATYVWSNGVTASTISSLCAGNYSVTATNTNGCTVEETYTISSPTPFTVTLNTTDESCGQSDGSICATVNGTSSSVSYLWNNGATTSCLNNVFADSYSVTVTNSSNCSVSESGSVSNSGSLTASISSLSEITCFEGCDGSLKATAVGATSPIYLWSNGATTSTISNLCDGTFTVTISEGGCSATESYTLSEPNALDVTLTPVDASCGQANGSVCASLVGSNASTTYLWSNGATTDCISNVVAGNYSVTISHYGCDKIESATVSNAGGISATAVIDDQISCFNACDGAISVQLSGANNPTYIWSNGETTSTLSNVCEGTFTVTVSQGACTSESSVTLTNPNKITNAFVTTDANCGQANGELCVSSQNGNGAVTYVWDNGETSSCIDDLLSGSYEVTATDAAGCFTVSQGQVNNQGGLQSSIDTLQALSCFNICDGSLKAIVTGATNPTYIWSNGATTPTISDLCAAVYTVTVEEAGCQSISTVELINPTEITTSFVVTNEVCGNTQGGSCVTATGGTGNLSYAWSNATTGLCITNVGANTYSVTVTDENGCTHNNSTTITNESNLSASVAEINAVSCSDSCDASAEVTVSGATSPTYLWSNGATTSLVQDLCAGTYEVTVSDQGCEVVKNITITNPAAIVYTSTNTSSTCGQNDGSLCVNVTGGNANYSFNWSNGETTNCINNLAANAFAVSITDASGCSVDTNLTVSNSGGLSSSITINTPLNCNSSCNGEIEVDVTGASTATYAWNTGATTAMLNNLCEDTYTVTVTDQTGCTSVSTINLEAPTEITYTTSTVKELCSSSNGEASIVNAAGGTGTLTYVWSNGATTSNITNQSAGTYYFTVTDANGCSVADSAVIELDGTTINADVNVQNTDCGQSNGVACVNTTSVGLTYLWSNGETSSCISNLPSDVYEVTITAASGCSITEQGTISNNDGIQIATTIANEISCNADCDGAINTSVSGTTSTDLTYAWSNGTSNANLFNLCADTYTVTVTDNSSGCTATSSETLADPLALSATAALTNASCGQNDGSICLTAVNGAAPITFNWEDGTTQNCLNNLAAASYAVTLTDANNCTAELTEQINNVGGVTIQTNVISNVSCNTLCDGEANVEIVTGSTVGLTYAWSNGATTTSINNVCAGEYTVTVTDASGCSNTVTVTITEPASLVLDSVNIINSNCGQADGSACAFVSGGTAPLTYTWNNGATTSCLNNVLASAYSFTVTDANSCEIQGQTSVSDNAGLSLTINIEDSISCYQSCDGVLNTTVTGSTNVSYLWSTGATSASLSDLCSGTYSLTITDIITNCTAVKSIILSEPAELVLNTTSTPDSCNRTVGSACVAVNGGTGAYTYSWSGLSATSCLSNVSGGNYDVTVSDENNCEASTSVVVTSTSSIDIELTQTMPISCARACDAVLEVAVLTGTPSTYSWSNGSTNTIANNLCAGSHSVTVTSDEGCTATETIIITEPVAISFSATVENAGCNNQPTGEICVTPLGGVSGYELTWEDGSLGLCSSNLSTGSYTVTIEDAVGCTLENTFEVGLPDPPEMNLVISETEGCAPHSFELGAQVNSTSTSGMIISWSISSGAALKLDNSLKYTIEEPGAHQVVATVSTTDGCNFQLVCEDSIHVYENPNANFDLISLPGSHLRYEIQPEEEAYNEWDRFTSNGTTIAEVDISNYYFNDIGNYEVCMFRTTTNGCAAETCKEVEVSLPFFAAHIPNAFTPNNDVNNQMFIPVLTSYDVSDYEFTIFNRWGDKVFHSNSPNEGWDGTVNGSPAKQDVYSFKLNLKDNKTGEHYKKANLVTLLR